MISKLANYTRRYAAVRHGLETPIMLIHFVTNVCNFRCKHCFYSADLDKKREHLSVEELTKIAKSLKQPLWSVLLTGGEPFLEKDLVAYCQAWNKYAGAKNFTIPTNAYMKDMVIGPLKQILDTTDAHVLIQVSLDGTEEVHDLNRKKAGSFRNAVEVIKAVKEMKKDYGNRLDVSVVTAIGIYNYTDFVELADYVYENLGVEHSFELVRGTSIFHVNRDLMNPEFNPPLEEGSYIPGDELDGVYQQVKNVYERYLKKTGGNFISSGLALSLAHIRAGVDTLKTQKQQVNCVAGNVIGVIFPNGDVSACELFRPTGNLRETDFDFHKLWNSEKFANVRKRIKRCYCTHGCFLQPSILYSPQTFIKYMVKN